MASDKELSRHIQTAYPFPIAFTYDRLLQCLEAEDSPAKAILLLRDCYESTVRYLALVSVALYVQKLNSIRNIETDRSILEKLALPSTGTWVALLELLAREFRGCEHRLGQALHASLFSEKRGKPKPNDTVAIFKRLARHRNDLIGHGATRRDKEYQEIVERERENLETALQRLSFLSEWTLFYPYRSDWGQRWMGPSEPHMPAELSDIQIANQHSGQYVLFNEADYFPLHPYVIDLKCPECAARRLCLYDSQARDYDKRKQITLLEYVGGHRFESTELAPALESHFEPQLMQDAYRVARDRLLKIEHHILDQSHLRDSHRDIVGREFLRLRVKEFIASHDCGVFLITGQPGIGKTAFLADYARRYQCPSFFYQRDSVAGSPDQCVQSLYHQLLKKLNRADRTMATTPAERRTKYANLLRETGDKVVIVMDALDEARDDTDFSALDAIPRDLPPGVFFVVASRETPGLRELHARPNTKSYHIEPSSEQNLRDAARFVQRQLEDLEITNAQIDSVVQAAEGNFLILGWICDAVQAGGVTIDDLSDPSQLGLGQTQSDLMQSFYEVAWNRLEQKVGNDLRARSVLLDVSGVLAVANAPLTIDQIADILQLHAYEVEFALHRLRQFLEVASTDVREGEINFYRLFHSTFRAYLAHKLASELASYHQAVVRYFSVAGAEEAYALDGLSHHLSTLTQLTWESLEPHQALFGLITRARAETCFERDGHYGRFLNDLGLAIKAARDLGKDGLPKLIELCLIESGFHTVAQAIPVDALIILAQCDRVERAWVHAESIGDRFERACALARLAAHAPGDRGEKIAEQALHEAQGLRGSEHISPVRFLTKVGEILISDFPEIGTRAFEAGFQFVQKHWGSETHSSPHRDFLDNWETAVSKAPEALIPYAERILALAKEKKELGSALLGDLAVPLTRLGHKDGLTYFEMARELADKSDPATRNRSSLVQDLIDSGRRDLAQEWYPGVLGTRERFSQIPGLNESIDSMIKASVAAHQASLEVDIDQDWHHTIKQAQQFVDIGDTTSALRLVEPLLKLTPREAYPFLQLQRKFIAAAADLKDSDAVFELVTSFPWQDPALRYGALIESLPALARLELPAALKALQNFHDQVLAKDSSDEQLGQAYNEWYRSVVDRLVQFGFGPDIAKAQLYSPFDLIWKCIGLGDVDGAQQILQITRQELTPDRIASLEEKIEELKKRTAWVMDQERISLLIHRQWPYAASQADEIRQGNFKEPIELYADPERARIIARALKEWDGELAIHYTKACYELHGQQPSQPLGDLWAGPDTFTYLFVELEQYEWANVTLRDYFMRRLHSFDTDERSRFTSPDIFECLDQFPFEVALTAIQDFIATEAAVSRLTLISLLEALALRIVRLLSVDQVGELLHAAQDGLDWWSSETDGYQ